MSAFYKGAICMQPMIDDVDRRLPTDYDDDNDGLVFYVPFNII